MDNEGWRVAEALADRGVTAFVLKYRLAPTPKDEAAFRDRVMKLIMGAAGKGPPVTMDPSNAIADGLAALKLVRGRSAEWGIDPARVGMIGFSAGAITTLGTVLGASKDADSATTPPDFIGYVYGPMDAVEVPADAPPLFTALAMNDGMFGKDNFNLANSWRNAGRPVELHVYQGGGHGFGLGKQGTTNSLLMLEFVTWLEMQGLLGSTTKP
jgi:acetyl esterase/lipase